MRSIDTEHVAEELIRIFVRVGLPKEILTDQGTNFTSELLAEIYHLLHIGSLWTSPYHPQTDGLVERFNGALKEMLRMYATQDRKVWDKLLSYVLFAYREAPHESTGFSPVELLYGWEVRRSLDQLKEGWEAKPGANENVMSHVLLMQDQLVRMAGVVQQNMKGAQARQKCWYDRTARERTLQAGEKVLVLLPTLTSKLLAQWHGSYDVVKRVGKVTYQVDMADKKKRRLIFHINPLRKWNESVSGNYFAEGDVEGEEEVITWNGGTIGGSQLGAGLTPEEQYELRELLHQHKDTLTSLPGCTHLTEHTIEAGDSSPIHLQPYRLPHTYRETVKRSWSRWRRTASSSQRTVDGRHPS